MTSTSPENSANHDVLLAYDILNSLSGFIGSSPFGQYLSGYLENTHNNIERLGHAIAAEDDERVRQLSHKLKGSAGNIGAMRLSGICERIQAIATHQESTEGMCNYYLQLEKIFDETRAALDDYINQLEISQANVG